MAKIDLNLLAYGAGEILTREELKNIVGGTEGSDVYMGSRSKTDKEKECDDKKLCDPCQWSNKYGQTIYGKCSQNAFAPYKYCSDLNCHW